MKTQTEALADASTRGERGGAVKKCSRLKDHSRHYQIVQLKSRRMRCAHPLSGRLSMSVIFFRTSSNNKYSCPFTVFQSIPRF